MRIERSQIGQLRSVSFRNEARRIASNIAKLPSWLAKQGSRVTP